MGYLIMHSYENWCIVSTISDSVLLLLGMIMEGYYCKCGQEVGNGFYMTCTCVHDTYQYCSQITQHDLFYVIWEIGTIFMECVISQLKESSHVLISMQNNAYKVNI